ncbi:MAG: hypothetical protein ACLT20_11330 [Lachnospiraceae bacterium]
MKNKYAAIVLGLALTISSCPVYAAENTTEATTNAENSLETETTSDSEAEENTVLGQVTAVNDDSITIAIGTQKEMQAPGGDGQGQAPDGNGDQQTPPEKPDDSNGDSSDQQTPPEKPEGSSEEGFSENDTVSADSGNGKAPEAPASNGAPDENGQGQPSMLDLTGEEQTITVTSDTVITRQTMQGPGGNGQGQAPDGNGAPDGQAPNGNADSSEPLSLSDLKEGDVVSVVLNDDGTAASITVQSMGGGNMGGVMGAPGGQSQGVDSYTAVNTYSEDTSLDGDSIESTGTDENTVLVDSGANVSIKNATITRNSEDSTGGDNSSFYGVGAAVLATDGTASVSNSTITTDAKGGAGLFAYGDSTIYAADSTITTHQDTSGGIHAAGGGTLYAWDLNVETNGESAAAIRSDRGGGTMVVDGGTYTSNGVGSPAVYCTANIAINNATLTANGSEAVCIEGLNSLHLFDCDLSGNMSDDDQNDCTWGVIVYQSMSGDSEVGNSTFQMTGGKLSTGNGGLLYTTNTECTLTLDSVDITYAPDSEFFLRCTGNNNQRDWGQTGNNGSDCLFTAINQEMQGDVVWDSISDLDFYITDNSTLTGAIIDDETYAGNGRDGYCNVYLAEGCTWTVTGDSTVSSIESEGSIVDADGKTVSIVGTDGTTYVEGDSEYTITTGSYSDSVNLTGATSEASWSDYSVERPDTL